MIEMLIVCCIAEMTQKDLKALGVLGGNLGHIGDGNFHAGVMYRRDDAQEKEKVEKFMSDMVDRYVLLDSHFLAPPSVD